MRIDSSALSGLREGGISVPPFFVHGLRCPPGNESVRLSPELHTSLSTVWDFNTPIVYKTGFSHTGLSTMWDFHTPHLSIFMGTF